MRKTAIISLVVCFSAVLLSTAVFSMDEYPKREIDMVIPWSPGGMTDISGRIFVQELTKVLKVPVTPMNRAGAGGTIGPAHVHNSRKDGYTLLFASLGNVIGANKVENVPYDPVKDFVAITMVCYSTYGIFVRPDSPYKELEDLIGQVKKQPESVSMAVTVGGDAHFNIDILQKSADINFNIVPYGGGGKSAPAVMGGHVDAGMTLLPSLIHLVKAGKLKILAQTGDQRSKYLPDVPTLKEKGFTQPFIDKNWNGLFAPAGVPHYVVDTLAAASKEAMKSEKMLKRLDETGNAVQYMGPEEFQKTVESDNRIIRELVEKLGLKKKK